MQELVPHLDKRTAFYRKAFVKQEDGATVLRSYDTDVAEIRNGKLRIFGFYSDTSSRHIRDFAYQNGFGVHSKRELEKYLV